MIFVIFGMSLLFFVILLKKKKSLPQCDVPPQTSSDSSDTSDNNSHPSGCECISCQPGYLTGDSPGDRGGRY